jgi:hypothetical protein
MKFTRRTGKMEMDVEEEEAMHEMFHDKIVISPLENC